MNSLETSSMDIMIPNHEYNQLVAISDQYIRQAQELQKQIRKYELMERDYLKLF